MALGQNTYPVGFEGALKLGFLEFPVGFAWEFVWEGIGHSFVLFGIL